MKLRNKKTGRVIEWFNNTDDTLPNSLAELNEKWEDYEEPKQHWFVDAGGEVQEAIYLTNNDKTALKKFGNYFETKEEAEKAVEKLKAWKRLKDKGFRFDGWDENHHNLGIIEFRFDKVENSVWDFEKDLDLLFGGEA